MKNQNKLLVVSPGRNSKGGISASVAAILDYKEFSKFKINWIETLNDKSIAHKILSLFWSLMNYLLKLPSCDFVHIHASSNTSFYRKSLFMLLAILYRKPFVVHIHPSHFLAFIDRSGFLVRWFIINLLRRAKGLIALSNDAANTLKIILKTNKVFVLPNPCPYLSLRKSVLLPSSGVLFFAGKIMPAKGCFELINAFSRVLKLIPDAQLIISGNGEVDRFKLYVSKLGLLNSITFTGWLEGEDLLSAYRNSDIFCLPSHSEGLPVSILQAMSQGIAVITTPVGGIPEVIQNGFNGIITPVGDEIALSDAIVNLFIDTELRFKIGNNAVDTIDANYSIDIVGKRLFTIYHSLFLLKF